jgi:digeranylgeranylglycerophospholipid reductase
MMQKPIAIIGGGPGGLSSAIRAAELGLRVVLYEKGQIGCGIKCAEGFIDTLGNLGKPESGVLYKVEKAIFFAGKEYHIHLHDNHGVWMIDRSIWQKSLAQKAQALGVSIKEDFPIGKNQITEMHDAYSYIIDASGAPSVTSRKYGFASVYLKNATLLAQYVIEGDFSFLGKNTLKASYESHYIGYNYIYPKGINIANVGVGRYYAYEKGKKFHLKKELDRLLRKEGLDGYAIRKKVSSFTPSSSVNKLILGNILLVGDAAALCSPLHGGGIDTACISGRLAAELIASQKVDLYPARLWEVLGKKLIMEKRVCNLWQFFGYPFIRGILRYPILIRGIIFNKRPIPQILGFGSKRVF